VRIVRIRLVITIDRHRANAESIVPHLVNSSVQLEANDAPIIRLCEVHKSFDGVDVLRGVSLDLRPGATTVILGPSGTGKSVLLKHIIGLLKPDQGEVYFKQFRIDRLDEKQLVEVRRRMGILFQMGALFDSMTVEQNVTFPLVEHTRMSPSDRADRCKRVLKIVGLQGIEKSMPADLSGGQRKRVALARAVVLEPQVVLYDEPTTGLDPIRADVINELIISLARRTGITSIVVTHDIASATKIADRMVMLYDGHIVADAEPKVFLEIKNELVQRFIHGQADREDIESIRAGFEPATDKTGPVS